MSDLRKIPELQHLLTTKKGEIEISPALARLAVTGLQLLAIYGEETIVQYQTMENPPAWARNDQERVRVEAAQARALAACLERFSDVDPIVIEVAISEKKTFDPLVVRDLLLRLAEYYSENTDETVKLKFGKHPQS